MQNGCIRNSYESQHRQGDDMTQTAFIQLEPIVCPRCGEPATFVEVNASVGLDHMQRRNIYGCATCTTPVYGIGQLSERFDPDPEAPGCGVSYKPFTFLSDGVEVF